ncbi:cell envelope biogenesis protein OmpA [Pseudomonadota bacterium]
MRRMFTGIVLGGLLAACASAPPKPVLYPNSHMQSVGQVQADQDIAACKQLAHSSGVAENKDGEVGKKAVGGAAVGGAAAGAWGLVRGDAGQSALAGAAAGAAAGTVRGGMQATETSPIFKNFVNRCLRERGYEVIGWQ